ncbi:MAG: hypothetical protein PHG00_17525 [Methylococcales bacterium]|nr:hypothetical protein [Methylococcales bacterium]
MNSGLQEAGFESFIIWKYAIDADKLSIMFQHGGDDQSIKRVFMYWRQRDGTHGNNSMPAGASAIAVSLRLRKVNADKQ